jgi:rhodanese-related sulfurtransferase
MEMQTKTRDDLLAAARAEITIVETERAELLITQKSLILDAREPAEFQLGHLPNAVNIPRGVLEFKVGNHPSLNDSQRSILLYCKNGGRSTLAAFTLKQMGFTKVEMLKGGFDDWSGH